MSGVNTMSEFIDFLALPHRLRADQHVVGWRDGHAVSNLAFKSEVRHWQQCLQAHPGRCFALYLQDSIAFAAVLIAAWQAGKIIYLPGDALSETCKLLASKVDGFIGDVDPQWQPLQAPATSATGEVADRGFMTPVTLDADFAGLIVHTSGSTGHAQAIPKKLGQLTREVATLEVLFGQQLAQCDVIATISHQHIYGLLFKILWPLAAGRAIHAQSAFFPEQLAAIVPAQRSWLLLSSPAHLKRLPENRIHLDGSHLRAVFSSGGPLLPEARQATEQLLGQLPIEIYGSSETGGIAWRQPAPSSAASATSDQSWQPMPQVQVRRNTDDDCLEVRSPHLPDEQWLRLADRVEFVAAQTSQFLLRGRADRIVKIEEKRISLDQIEHLLQASPLVAEVRVLMHPSLQWQGRDRIAAFIVLNELGRQQLLSAGKWALNHQLRAQLLDRIAHIALPRQWRYLENLPANAQGKVTNGALLALLEQEQPMTMPALMPEALLRQRSDTQVTLDLHISTDLLYFQGHFPGTPILPGVVQLDWALTLGRQYFNLPPVFLGMRALKFQNVIRPGSDIVLELKYEAASSALSFRLHSSIGQHASGRILLGVA
jgi:acyl-coenzyme A synthetase/AMP-(fatty) acid ligase